MTKPVSRKMAVDAILYRITMPGQLVLDENGHFSLVCAICGHPLRPGDVIQFDHVHSDVMDGPHGYRNLRPVHYDPCHKAKTKKDVAANSKVKRILGLTKNGPKAKIRSGRKLESGNKFPPRGSTPMRRPRKS